MKIICIMVSSVDGKITQWFNPHLHFWTSKEDQQYFAKTRDAAKLIIQGRKTYEAAKPTMKHSPDKLRVILTSNPKKYAQETIPGQLEFTNEDPTSLVQRLEKQGYSQALLVGGGNINTEFFKQGLVNELWLTIEPKLFGKGNMIVSESELDIALELISVEKLNPQGTLLLKYIIVKQA